MHSKSLFMTIRKRTPQPFQMVKSKFCNYIINKGFMYKISLDKCLLKSTE